MDKLTLQQVSQFITDFYAGKYPNQRLGQAFVNNRIDIEDFNFSEHIEAMNLFYCDDEGKAINIIYTEFVTYE